MSYSELIQVIGLSCLLTLALIMVLTRLGRRFLAIVQGLLPPRYLKSRGVRRRAPAQSEPHEPV
ncbi:cellulose biosynthesis protein BcsF [Pseudomonas batumici]|uniref:cellulose biosynthesis protein BcsF n=1 Tax=Pseudomonas batumici TaxID=226910 RepID=UPI0030D3E3CC